MAANIYPKLGFWRDYSRGWQPGCQILVTDRWSHIITSVVSIFVSVFALYTFKVGKHLCLWIYSSIKHNVRSDRTRDEIPRASTRSSTYGTFHPGTPGEGSTEVAGEEDGGQRAWNQEGGSGETEHDEPQGDDISHRPLLEHRPGTDATQSRNPASHDPTTVVIFRRSHSLRDALGNMTRLGAERPTSWWKSAPAVFIWLALLALITAWAIGGALSSDIASGTAALSASKVCGMWELPESATIPEQDVDYLYTYSKESRAAQYAQNCHPLVAANLSLGCNFFYNQSISFTTSYRQPCPFKSKDMCLSGPNSAVSMTTGLVDAGVIGVNDGHAFQFRRNSTCSPLQMNETFITASDVNEDDDTEYLYYYGKGNGTDRPTPYTYSTYGDPFNYIVPVYILDMYYSSLSQSKDDWAPIEALGRPQGSTATIMFVTSARIYHLESSEDPVFPATQRDDFDGDGDPLYYNDEPRARVFACVETTELCSPKGRECWRYNAEAPLDAVGSASYWYTRYSLANSNMFDSVKWRRGSALRAQELVSGYVSRPLNRNPTQWVIEVQNLFATSLARIQWDAMSIGIGEDQYRPGYRDETPSPAKGHLCGKFKYKTTDYTNINLFWLIVIPVVCLLVWAASIDVKESILGAVLLRKLGRTIASYGNWSWEFVKRWYNRACHRMAIWRRKWAGNAAAVSEPVP